MDKGKRYIFPPITGGPFNLGTLHPDDALKMSVKVLDGGSSPKWPRIGSIDEALQDSTNHCPRCGCKIQECEKSCPDCHEYLFEENES